MKHRNKRLEQLPKKRSSKAKLGTAHHKGGKCRFSASDFIFQSFAKAVCTSTTVMKFQWRIIQQYPGLSELSRLDISLRYWDRKATVLLPTLIHSYYSGGRSTSHFPLDKRDDCSFCLTNFPFLRNTITSLPAYAILSYNSYHTQGCVPVMSLLFQGDATFQLASQSGICQRPFEIVSWEVLLSVRGSYQTIWSPPLQNATRHSGGW